MFSWWKGEWSEYLLPIHGITRVLLYPDSTFLINEVWVNIVISDNLERICIALQYAGTAEGSGVRLLIGMKIIQLSSNDV